MEDPVPASGAMPPAIPGPRPGKRWRRRLAITALGLAVLLLTLVLATPLIVDGMVRPRLEAALSDGLRVPVTMRSASFSWFSGLVVEDLRIGNVPGGDRGDLLSLSAVTGDISLPALLSGRVELRRDLVLAAPRLRLVVHADGTTNLQALFARFAPAAPASAPVVAPAPASPASGAAAPPQVVGRLVIRDAQVLVVDAAGRESALPPLNASLAMDTFARPVQLELASADRSLVLAARLLVAGGPVTGSISYHITPAFSVGLRPLLTLAPMVGACDATLAGDGEWSLAGPAEMNGKGTLMLAAERVVVTVPASAGASARTYAVVPGITTLDYVLQSKEGGVMDGRLALASPGARATVTVSGTGRDAARRMQLRSDATLDLGELARRFPGLIGDPRRGALAGSIATTVTASFLVGGDAVGEANLTMSGKDIGELGADGKVVPLLDELRLGGSVSVDSRTGRYVLRQGVVHAAGLDVTADAEVTLARADQPAAPVPAASSLLQGMSGLSATVRVQADFGQVLTAARRLVPALPMTWDAAGTLVADLAVGGDQARPEGLRGTFTLKADRLHVRGIPAVADLDLSPSVTMVVSGLVDPRQGRITLDRAVGDSPMITFDACGSAVDGLFSPAPMATVALQLKARPGPLAAMLWPTGGSRLAGEDMALRIVGTAGGAGGSLDIAVGLPRLVYTRTARDTADRPEALTISAGALQMKLLGEAAWTRIQVEAPSLGFKLLNAAAVDDCALMAERVSWDRSCTTCRFSAMKIAVPGFVFAGTGGLAMSGIPGEAVVDATTCHLSADLKPLMGAMRRHAGALGGNLLFDGEGVVTIDASAAGRLDGLVLKPVTMEVRQLRLAGPGLDHAVTWPVSAVLEADLRCAPLDVTHAPLAIERLLLRGPGGMNLRGTGSLVVADLMAALARLGDAAASPGVDSAVALNLEGGVVVAELCALLPSLAARKDITVAPDAQATTTITLSGTAQAPHLALTCIVPPLRIAVPAGKAAGRRDGTMALKASTVSCALAVACASGTVTLEPLSLVTDLAQVQGRVVATLDRASGGGLAALQAKLSGQGEFNQLVTLARSMGFVPEDVTLGGDRLEWELTASTGNGGDIPLAFIGALPNGIFSRGAMGLPKQDVRMEVRGILKDRGQTLILDPASHLTASTIQVHPRGTLRRLLSGQPLADHFSCGLTIVPAAINPLLTALGGGVLNGSKPESSQIAMSGPLVPPPATNLLGWLNLLDTHDTRLAFGSWTSNGFTIVGPPLPLALAKGRLDLAYRCTVNGGATDLDIVAELPREHVRLHTSTAKLHLSNDLAWLIAYANPIFHLDQQGTLTGDATLTVDGTWQGSLMPAPFRPALGTCLESRGRLAASQVAITGSKLLTALVDALSGGASGNLIEVAPTDFRIHEGVLSYQGMQVRIGDLRLVFAGTAHLVTDALDMTVTTPFPSRLAVGAAAKYVPATLTMPIRGTVSDPRYDFAGALRDALKQVLEKAGREELKDRAGGILEKLLKNR